jgi:hypothetical protein
MSMIYFDISANGIQNVNLNKWIERFLLNMYIHVHSLWNIIDGDILKFENNGYISMQ